MGPEEEDLDALASNGTGDDSIQMDAVSGVMLRPRSEVHLPSTLAQQDALVYARSAWGLAKVGSQRETVRHDFTQLLESGFSEGLLAAVAPIGLPSDILERIDWDLKSHRIGESMLAGISSFE
ncbi:MAG: hypothetical protein KDB83_01720 [Actinobacteria bacterium]|nr:hypothetical protein [Actinomycetota bacterium]